MGKGTRPRWTANELAVIRSSPATGPVALTAALPRRSAQAIAHRRMEDICSTVSFRLPTEEVAEARRFAALHGLSLAQLARQLVRDIIRAERDGDDGEVPA